MADEPSITFAPHETTKQITVPIIARWDVDWSDAVIDPFAPRRVLTRRERLARWFDNRRWLVRHRIWEARWSVSTAVRKLAYKLQPGEEPE